MQPQFNDEGFVRVVVPDDLVLIPLPGLLLELLLYVAHVTRNRPKLADPKVSRTEVSLLVS